MSNLLRAIQKHCAILIARTSSSERTAAPLVPFNPVVPWGRSFEERYKNWDKERKPTRPSPQELEIYEKFIGPIAQRRKILILGPTPELRNLVAEHAVVVADLSASCIEEASVFMTAAKPSNEQRVVGNWLSLPFPDGYFDVVLGDMVLNQFPPGQENGFLREVRRLCAVAGTFISRFIFTDPDFLPEHLPEAVKRFVGDPSLSRREKAQAIAIVSITCTSDRTLRLNNLYGAWTVLENLSRREEMDRRARSAVRDAIRYLKTNGFPGDRWWTFPSEEELVRLTTGHFAITERAYALDQPFGRFLPIMRCVPRNR